MQGPDTDAQDQSPPFTQIRLATHGRSIQLGQTRKCSVRADVFRCSPPQRTLDLRLAARPRSTLRILSAARLIPENPIPHRAAASSPDAEALAEVRVWLSQNKSPRECRIVAVITCGLEQSGSGSCHVGLWRRCREPRDMIDTQQRSPSWEHEMRARRFVAFAERQHRQRKWVRLSKLALHYARVRSPDALETLPDLWIMQGYSALSSDIRAGFFNSEPQPKFSERGTRLHLLYLHPSISPDRMTIERLDLMRSVLGRDKGVFDANAVACCWTPAALATAWCVAHDLPPLTEKRGPKEKDDAFIVAAALRYYAEGYSQRAAVRMAVNDAPESPRTSVDSMNDRIRRKMRDSLRADK